MSRALSSGNATVSFGRWVEPSIQCFRESPFGISSRAYSTAQKAYPILEHGLEAQMPNRGSALFTGLHDTISFLV